MLPMKTSSVFRSRWMALLWAAGIIWFAYDFAAMAPATDNSTANADQANSDDQSEMSSAVNSL